LSPGSGGAGAGNGRVWLPLCYVGDCDCEISPARPPLTTHDTTTQCAVHARQLRHFPATIYVSTTVSKAFCAEQTYWIEEDSHGVDSCRAARLCQSAARGARWWLAADDGRRC